MNIAEFNAGAELLKKHHPEHDGRRFVVRNRAGLYYPKACVGPCVSDIREAQEYTYGAWAVPFYAGLVGYSVEFLPAAPWTDEASAEALGGKDSEYEKLSRWLRDNSSGSCRKCAEAADVIETLCAEVRRLYAAHHLIAESMPAIDGEDALDMQRVSEAAMAACKKSEVARG